MPSCTRLIAILPVLVAGATAGGPMAYAGSNSDVVKSITIRAPRDLGYFAGDLVKADIEIIVANGTTIETASLPHPGPINYWLDLRSIDMAQGGGGADQRYILKIVYQDFYDALDARAMEIPTFPVLLKTGQGAVTVDVPPWTIGVSPLREVSPPVKSDPKDYMRADQPAPSIPVAPMWTASAAAFVAALAALVLLARDRAWWPFHVRPARVFGAALRRLRRLGARRDTDDGYLEALLVMHRGVDQTDGRRVLADDLPDFLRRHPVFVPLRDRLAAFFTASRHAFFGSDPARSRRELPFDAIETFARKMAAAERTRP